MGGGVAGGADRAVAARAVARQRPCPGSGSSRIGRTSEVGAGVARRGGAGERSSQQWRATGSRSWAVRQGCAVEPCSLPAPLLRGSRSCSRSPPHRRLVPGGVAILSWLVCWPSLRGTAACSMAVHSVLRVHRRLVVPRPRAHRYGRRLPSNLSQRFFLHHCRCTFRTARRPIPAATCVACMSIWRLRLPQAPTPYPHPAPGWVV